MAYNKKNKLQLIISVQQITLEHTHRGATQEWVYREIIYPRYLISKRTYYKYLASRAKREIKALPGATQRSLF